MTLNRRQMLQAGLGAAAAGALSSCAGLTGRSSGGEAPSGSSGGEKVTLTFINWSGDTEKKAFDDVIAAFQKENPNITIKTDTVPYASVATNIDSRFQSGNPPDLFRVSYIDIGQYTSQDVLLDVSGTFDQAKIDAFVPGLWESIVYDGKPYGVPHQIDCTALLYRKDAFQAAGITDVPTTLEDAWTWDEFAAVADKLKGVVKARQYPFIYDWQAAGAYRWLSWLFQAGGNLLQPDLKAPAVDSDAGRKAVEFTQSFFTKGWVAKNTSVKATTYPDNEFIAGTVAIAFAGSFLRPGHQRRGRRQVRVRLGRDAARRERRDRPRRQRDRGRQGRQEHRGGGEVPGVHRPRGPDEDLLREDERAAHTQIADRDEARLPDQARPDAAVRPAGLDHHARSRSGRSPCRSSPSSTPPCRTSWRRHSWVGGTRPTPSRHWPTPCRRPSA